MFIMDFNTWFKPLHPGDFIEKKGFFDGRREDNQTWPESDIQHLILMLKDQLLSADFIQNLALLHDHFPFLKINNAGTWVMDTPTFVLEPVLHCLQNNMIPFMVGADRDLLSLLQENTDARLTYLSNQLPVTEEIREGTNYIGYQRHLCEYKALKYVEEFCHDSLSLGQMKSNPHLLEPILRDTEILYIHLNVLRSAEIPGSKDSWPSGLNTEEICQILKYAGHSTQLKAVILDTTGVETTLNKTESKLLAELFWYLCEGMKMRQTDHPTGGQNMSEYLVNMADYDTELVFVRSNVTNRWWLKIQDNETYPFLSCSQEEYQQAIQNEVPERLLRHILL